MNKLTGHLLAFLTVAVWSSTFLVSKIVLRELLPIQVLGIRFFVAVVFLSIIFPHFKKPNSIKEELLFFLSGSCLAAYFYFENSALIYTYSSNVSLIVATIPMITALISAIFLKSGFFSAKKWAGFMLAYFGVFLIIINVNKFEGTKPLGDFLALGAALMFAVYTLLMQKIKGEYNLIELTRKVMGYGLIVFAVINLFSYEAYKEVVFSKELFLALVYLGIVASSLAFLMWNKAIVVLGSVETNKYIYLVPVLTTFLSAIILHEKITYITILGTILILLGLSVSEGNNKEEKKFDL